MTEYSDLKFALNKYIQKNISLLNPGKAKTSLGLSDGFGLSTLDNSNFTS
ncbi:hypothetical protein [Calothrix sp. CCY 0018]